MYDKNKNKYIKKKNVYYRPWGRYTNLFEGKEFLIKELFVKPKGILSYKNIIIELNIGWLLKGMQK
jgi:mannose-6-phosphate isomerase-like protein (cupin superfamily)